ncbi:hypothetical protein [Novosphingobium sp.]|uniref:hypothetical protein n=1 Tax=Novosphingobium sp. TaxID=1874826 RepID=UPI00352AA786
MKYPGLVLGTMLLAGSVQQVCAQGQGSAATPAAAVSDQTATAQPAPAPVEVIAHPPADAAADGCELHIWPAQRMTSMTTGLLGGGLLDAAIHGNRDATNRTLLASALDSPSQLDALQALDLRTELKLTPGTTIITHSQPVDRHTMNSVKTRRGESPSKCYSELIVADVFYQKAAIYGRSLRTLFMVRDFGAGEKIAFEYKAWGGNGLKLFPPKEGEDAVAALDELVAVFKKNFQEYANNERKAPRTPAKS